MASSERPSPEPLLEKEAFPAALTKVPAVMGVWPIPKRSLKIRQANEQLTIMHPTLF